jgi:hypothetical protein
MVTSLALAAAIAASAPSCPSAPEADWSVQTPRRAVELAEKAAADRFGVRAAKHQPYRAELAHGIWSVSGALAPGWRGGTPEVKICASTGQVLAVVHGR